MNNTLAFIQNLRGPEILLIALVVLLLFGAKRLPELFRSLGQSLKEFKKATSDAEDGFRNAMESEDPGKQKEESSQSGSAKKDTANAEPASRDTPPSDESPRKD
ncbi:MAG: twin-arginine translocase TatA/TatE family subunit [Opitutales bacterium]